MDDTPVQPCTPHVYFSIAKVIEALTKEGIGKGRKNAQQGFSFRGIDDIYNAVAPLLAAHKLTILPRYTAREVVERQSQKGGALFYVTVVGEFDFVSAVDGSKHMVGPFYGEAMDSGDKATNKAMSAAYKYACLQAFCIPTEGDNDADATTHEVEASVSIEEARELAMDMLALLHPKEDLSEEAKALSILDLHDRVKHITDLYVAASAQLKPNERNAFKAYIEMGKTMAKKDKMITDAGKGVFTEKLGKGVNF